MFRVITIQTVSITARKGDQSTMKTLRKQTTGRSSLTTKAVHAFLGLVMLTPLAALGQPVVKHIGEEIPQLVHHICPSCGEEIPQLVYHPCRSCGEEIPQGANSRGEELAGGVAGGVIWRNRG